MPPRSIRTPLAGRADHAVVGIEFERRQSRADRDVEGAAREVEHVARDHEALHRRRADPRALAGRQLVDPRDVAVGQEAAQFAFEAVREIERGLGRLRRVPRVRVHGVHLEDGGHGLVREAPHVAPPARPSEFQRAVHVGECRTLRGQ